MCPDCTVRLFFVHWLFDLWQIIGIIAIWELEKFLWRIARGKTRLTRKN